MKSDHQTVLALYGVSGRADALSAFWEANIRSDFARLGDIKVSVVQGGRRTKPTAIGRVGKKLEASGFEGVSTYTIFVLGPDAHDPIFDSLYLATFAATSSYALVAINSGIATLGATSLTRLLEQFVEALSPTYGIGYERRSSLGPVSYAVGIAQGLATFGSEYDEALRISKWGYRDIPGKTYRSGVLRDLYEWNILSEVHKDTLMEGTPVIDWVVLGKGLRGSIRPIGRNHWLWEIKRSDLSRVREDAIAAGMRFVE